MILLAFFAVSMMIVGGADDSDVKQVSKLAIIMLIFNPILISAGIICMRSLRKTNEWVVSACSNLFQIFGFLPFVYYQGGDLF